MPPSRPYDSETLRRRAQAAAGLALGLFGLAVPLSIAGANIAWGLLLAALLAYAASGGALPFSSARGALELPLWLYLAVALLSAALGIDPRNSARYLHQDVHKVWLYYLFSLGLALGTPSRLLPGLALGFGAAAVVGIWQTSTALASTGHWLRAHAFVHPVTYGEQIGLGLIGAVCFLLRPGPELAGRAAYRGAVVVAALMAAALVLSNTRAAVLSAAAGIAAVCLLLPGIRRWAVAAAGSAAAAIVVMEFSIPERAFLRELTGGFDSFGGQFLRFRLWRAAWEMGWDHPWTGVGYNNFRTAFGGYFTGLVEGTATSWGTAHNLYIHQFAERGALGAAAILLLMGAYWHRAWRRARESPDAWNLWAYGAATAFLLMNLTEVAFQTEVVWMLALFIWLCAEARHRARAG